MTTTDTLIDRTFDKRYVIKRKLGSGGMADVYLAEDQELGRRVAIKILNDRHANDEQFVERFRREAKNAAGLSHPNIVKTIILSQRSSSVFEYVPQYVQSPGRSEWLSMKNFNNGEQVKTPFRINCTSH